MRRCRQTGNRAGRDDPKAMGKFEHGEKVIEAQKRIAVPRKATASLRASRREELR
jgi:hypothetical protein